MSTILKSLHGNQLGLDADGYLTGPVVAKFPTVFVGASGSELDPNAVTSATTATTGTTITAAGITTVQASTTKGFTLAAPVTGNRKTLVATTTSTYARTITLVSGNYLSTAGSGGATITLDGEGDTVTLTALSTALWAVTAIHGAAIS